MPDFTNIIKIFSCISLVIGAVECFAGFKAMKVMLAIWGFFIGALIGTIGGVCAKSFVLGAILVIVFGALISFLAYKLYLAGVFLYAMFLTGASVWLMFNNVWAALFLGLIVGVLAMFFVKPVVIVSTAFSGSGILVVSAFLSLGLLSVNDGREFSFVTCVVTVLWVVIAVAGILCQYVTTQCVENVAFDGVGIGKNNNLKMQRAYRNFCINCGRKVTDQTDMCPRCGYKYED